MPQVIFIGKNISINHVAKESNSPKQKYYLTQKGEKFLKI